MTSEDFRRVALSMPNAVEGAHMSRPDFRVRNKVFATRGYPDDQWGMVKLTPEQQEMLVGAEPTIFKAVNGAWGRRGGTQVLLQTCEETTARSAITMAWGNIGRK